MKAWLEERRYWRIYAWEFYGVRMRWWWSIERTRSECMARLRTVCADPQEWMV